jgi:hypothetical protein
MRSVSGRLSPTRPLKRTHGSLRRFTCTGVQDLASRATSAFESAGSGGQRDLRAAAGLRRQRPVLDDAEHTQDEEDDEQRDDDANDS